jgi:hypothetical protein
VKVAVRGFVGLCITLSHLPAELHRCSYLLHELSMYISQSLLSWDDGTRLVVFIPGIEARIMSGRENIDISGIGHDEAM